MTAPDLEAVNEGLAAVATAIAVIFDRTHHGVAAQGVPVELRIPRGELAPFADRVLRVRHSIEDGDLVVQLTFGPSDPDADR